jgi:hypothetical protein
MKDFSITEGSNFSFSCPVNPGNPNDTEIKWTANGHIIKSGTKILSFHNVSRKHDMIYTCTVSNIMNPTDNNQEKGTQSKRFHLDVECEYIFRFPFAINFRVINSNYVTWYDMFIK